MTLKKCFRIAVLALLAAALGVPALGAQASSLKGMSLNGSTGLYSIPSGRIGWEQTADFGFDLGYHMVMYDSRKAHIPKIGVSLFNWAEINAAFDIQPDAFNNYNNNTSDFIGGAKVQIPLTRTAIALGGNFQFLNPGNDNDALRYNAGQVYAAVTYAGQFFDMPAETTAVVGKSFIKNHSDSSVDFGMGFDIILLPNVLQNIVHWVTDFSNFSYSVEPFAADHRYRGVCNTGLRLDLSVIPILDRFKFIVDVLVTDVLDTNRAFSIGGVFGVSVR